jgi:hypothetical protein
MIEREISGLILETHPPTVDSGGLTDLAAKRGHPNACGWLRPCRKRPATGQ